MRPAAALWGAAFLAGVAVAAYAVFVEPRRLRFTFVRVADGRVTAARRYLVLSDLHLRRRSVGTYRHLGRAAAWAAANGARTALIAGDVVDDQREAELVGRALRRALAPLEVMYVSGNHDAGGLRAGPRSRRNDAARIEHALARSGIACLDGRMRTRDGIAVVGLRWSRSSAGRAAERAALLAEAAPPRVVLTHSPDHALRLPADRVLIALCGHTHGGQVRLPFIGAPWTPVRTRLPRLAGLMRLDGVPVYVSRGVGATVPVRLGAVPEAVLLELAPDRSAAAPAGARRVEVR